MSSLRWFCTAPGCAERRGAKPIGSSVPHLCEEPQGARSACLIALLEARSDGERMNPTVRRVGRCGETRRTVPLRRFLPSGFKRSVRWWGAGPEAAGRVALSGGRLARSDCIQLARTAKARPAVRRAGAWRPQPLDTNTRASNRCRLRGAAAARAVRNETRRSRSDNAAGPACRLLSPIHANPARSGARPACWPCD